MYREDSDSRGAEIELPYLGIFGPLALLFGAKYFKDPRVVAWIDAIAPGLVARLEPVLFTLVFMSGGVLTVGVFAIIGLMRWRAERLETHKERVYTESLRGSAEAGGLRVVRDARAGGVSEVDRSR